MFEMNPRYKIAALLLCVFGSSLALAHQQPMTLASLDVGSDRIAMDLHIPLPELELAFGHHVTERPEQTLAQWSKPLQTYLADHIRPVTTEGQPWSVALRGLRVGHSEQAQSGPFHEVSASLDLIPPSGASLRDFVLNYDVILHQVVTHKALLSVHCDWAAGQVESTQLGVIGVNTGTGRVEPIAIHLGEASWWSGFKHMVGLGAEHIREGLDHLLFLIVLLLPATLTVRGREWGEFGGVDYSLLHLLKIVTAFTLGHSATLIAGALHWVTLPSQPVEILIACSILVTAIHAIRPIFPGRETQVAAGFGLVHGLAFASILADLKLDPGPLALSIFGFNLGIELTQLFVIAVTVPWLILLSLTEAHKWVRCGAALLAASAAIGWIASRISTGMNGFEHLMTTVTKFAPLGVLILALIAIPAYLHQRFITRELPE